MFQEKRGSPEQRAAIEQIANVDQNNVQAVYASQLAILDTYYKSVLSNATRSFLMALVAGVIGLVFYMVAVTYLMRTGAGNAVVATGETVTAVISLIAGSLIELISGLNFYLYGLASKQLASFHNRLYATQRLLLANSICSQINGSAKDEVRAELVRLIAAVSAFDSQVTSTVPTIVPQVRQGEISETTPAAAPAANGTGD